MQKHVIEDAKRCLQCKNPLCSKGCPINTPIKEAIGLLLDSKLADAGKLLFENNPLSLVCSHICPQENQCEGHCVLGKNGGSPVFISAIEKYISDYYLNIAAPTGGPASGYSHASALVSPTSTPAPASGDSPVGAQTISDSAGGNSHASGQSQKDTQGSLNSAHGQFPFPASGEIPSTASREGAQNIALIGSGPAGIAIAFYLLRKNYNITIFEGNDRVGGVLRYGIPEFRLPKQVIDRLVDLLIKSGVKIRPNTTIGDNLTIDDLFRDGFDAVFIGTGTWKPRKLSIKGESLGHVHFAINYLKNPDVYNLGNTVIVIGAGNVAMDVARTAFRHGCRDVTIFYHRGEEDITARTHELQYAMIDGAKLETMKTAIEITDKGVIFADSEIVTEGGEQIVRAKAGTEKLYPCDSVIVAASQGPRSVIASSTKNIKTTDNGLAAVDEFGRTSRPGVFAGGDVVTGAKTVVEAVTAARKVAVSIDEYLQSIKKEK